MSRKTVLSLVEEANFSGACKKSICNILEISMKTLTRWQKEPDGSDGRKKNKFSSTNKLSKAEEEAIIRLVSSSEYRDKTPIEIVALEAEKGNYLASERTIYRVLEKYGLKVHRSKSKAPQREKPSEFVANGLNQIWSWDISYLLTNIRGYYIYLYLIIDIWDRSIVGWSLHDTESGEYASRLLRKTCLSNMIKPKSIVLHQDNGAPMISSEFKLELSRWGISSYSRPGVSDDNPFSESQFKTLKYQKNYPEKFRDMNHALEWMKSYENWYNNEHLHSGIGYVTPHDRRYGKDIEKLQKRSDTYALARSKNPKRWSGETRKWNSPKIVYLNCKNKYKELDKNVA